MKTDKKSQSKNDLEKIVQPYGSTLKDKICLKTVRVLNFLTGNDGLDKESIGPISTIVGVIAGITGACVTVNYLAPPDPKYHGLLTLATVMTTFVAPFYVLDKLENLEWKLRFYNNHECYKRREAVNNTK